MQQETTKFMQYPLAHAKITFVSFLKEPAFISADSFTETY